MEPATPPCHTSRPVYPAAPSMPLDNDRNPVRHSTSDVVQHTAHQNGTRNQAEAQFNHPNMLKRATFAGANRGVTVTHRTALFSPRRTRRQREHVPQHEHEHPWKPNRNSLGSKTPVQASEAGVTLARANPAATKVNTAAMANGLGNQRWNARVSVQSRRRPRSDRGRSRLRMSEWKSSSPAGADGMGGTAGMGAALTVWRTWRGQAASARSTRHAFKST